MYGLFARMYGNNNLPEDRTCATKPHRWRSPESIGVPVGTVTLDDFENSRLHLLLRTECRLVTARVCFTNCSEQAQRGVPIVTFNPLRERARTLYQSAVSERNADRVAEPDQLAIPSGESRRRHRRHHRVCARRCFADRRCRVSPPVPGVLDRDIHRRAHPGFEGFGKGGGSCSWQAIEHRSSSERGATGSCCARFMHAAKR